MTLHERVLIAEGDPDLREGLVKLLSREGHTVVDAVGSVAEVHRVARDANPEKDFRVAVVSGYLPMPGDGALAATVIREMKPEAVIVAFSADHQVFGDHNIAKSPGVLRATIKAIPPRKP